MSVAKKSRHHVFYRDQWTCRYCLCLLTPESATIDHIIPRSKGGPTQKSNLVAACRPCNAQKKDKSLEEAGMTLHPLPAVLPLRATIRWAVKDRRETVRRVVVRWSVEDDNKSER